MQTPSQVSTTSPKSLLQLYQAVSSSSLPEELWDEWLWRTDPEEPYSADVLMNRCQLLGLLICLYKGALADTHTPHTPNTLTARFSLMETPICEMSLQELKDTIENLQLEWPSFLERLPQNPNAQQNLDAVVLMIDQCVARFGALCSQTYSAEVLDDLCSVDEAGPGQYCISTACIRRTVCTFLVLYRHLHLLAVAETASGEWCDCGISKYHLEASNDDFNLLCMHLSLPVGAKLNYKMDFAQMYNHVSQAVFFHNPEYQRTARVGLDRLSAAGPEQVLPALWQLYPEIKVKYEEDAIDLTSAGREWVWFVVAGRIYLVEPGRRVWYSPSVTSLLVNVYKARAKAE